MSLERLMFRKSLRERLTAAWVAFKEDTRAEAYHEYQARRDAVFANSLAKLEPFDRAMVESIAGGSAASSGLLSQVMPKIEELGFVDQVNIMKVICRGNPALVRSAEVRAWNSKHFRAVAASIGAA